MKRRKDGLRKGENTTQGKGERNKSKETLKTSNQGSISLPSIFLSVSAFWHSHCISFLCHWYSAASKNIKVNLAILHEKRKVK